MFKALKIKKGSASGKMWTQVSPQKNWERLKRGLDDNLEGAGEAVTEVYAVVTGQATKDLQPSAVALPHHEVTENGTIVLVRGGLMAAAEQLATVKAPAQVIEAARQHLRAHFKEAGLPLPDILAQGEMVSLRGTIAGEMQVESVPLAPGVDIAALQEGDDNPLQVVLEIPAGKSKRGWDYTEAALKKIVGEVAQNTAAGYLGHQKPEDISNEFIAPVTHWVGAVWQNGRAYFRGVIDAAATDLKRWIKTRRVTQGSIYGMPTLRTVGGETQVVDYELLSIDWTPLGRAGMPTRIVAVGEMDTIVEPLHNAGENGEGDEVMTFAELMAALKQLGAAPGAVIGEMGWQPTEVVKALGAKLEEVAPLVDPDGWKQLQALHAAVGEMAQLHGLSDASKLDELVNAVKAAHAVQQQHTTSTQKELVSKVVGEMVVNEKARPLVQRLLGEVTGTEEEVKKAVGELLQQEDVKSVLAGMVSEGHVFKPKGGDQGNLLVRTKTVAI